LMRGVSEGFQTILRGLDWKEGDHVLMTAEEEAALFLPTLHLRDLFGVKVDKIPLVNDLQGQVDAVTTRPDGLSHGTGELLEKTLQIGFCHRSPGAGPGSQGGGHVKSDGVEYAKGSTHFRRRGSEDVPHFGAVHGLEVVVHRQNGIEGGGLLDEAGQQDAS